MHIDYRVMKYRFNVVSVLIGYNDSHAFDAEIVESVIGKMKRGKAAGLDGIMCEHLLFSHPLLPGILAKLFNKMIAIGHVPLDSLIPYLC